MGLPREGGGRGLDWLRSSREEFIVGGNSVVVTEKKDLDEDVCYILEYYSI